MTPTRAVAEAWASMDGKLDRFLAEATAEMPLAHPQQTMTYEAYIAEAEEMIRRIVVRGYTLVANDEAS